MTQWTLIIVGMITGYGAEYWRPPMVVPHFTSAKTCSDAVPFIMDAKLRLIDPDSRFGARIPRAIFTCVQS